MYLLANCYLRFLQSAGEGPGGELRSLVGVEDLRSPLPQRRLQGHQAEGRLHGVGKLPGGDAPLVYPSSTVLRPLPFGYVPPGPHTVVVVSAWQPDKLESDGGLAHKPPLASPVLHPG